MKNLFKTMMLVAAAATGLAACTNDTTEDFVTPAGSGSTKTVTISADITRTQFADANRGQLAWSANDALGVFTDVSADKNTQVTYDGKAFGELTVDAAATKVYAYYPLNSANDNRTADAVRIDIPQAQTQTAAGVFDGKYMPMIATGTIESDNSVKLAFKPVACALALNICNGQQGETITKVTFESNEKCSGYDTKGNNITAGADKFVYEGYKNTANVTVDKVPADGTVTNKQTFENQIYLVVAKKSYTAGAKFVVETSLNSYTFTTKKELDCSAADFKPVTLDLSIIAKEEPVTYTYVSSLSDLNTTDTYIIAGNKADTFAGNSTMYVWAGTVNSSKNSQLDCVEYVADGETLSVKPSTIAEIKLETTGTANSYYIKVGDKYLYNASSNSLSISESKSAWNIVEMGGVKEGIYFKSSNCYMFCNSASTTALRAYTSQKPTYGIYIFKKADPNAPQLTITSEKNISVDADGLVNNGQDFPTITYEIKNPNTEWSVNASVPTEDQSWITSDMSTEGSIVLDIKANEGTARSTTVTITYGTISKTVTIKQAGTADAALGKAYSYEFTAQVYSSNGKKTLGALPWTLAGDGGHWSYDSTKGQHLGSGNNPYKNMTLTLSQSDYAAYSPDSQAVQKVIVNTCGGSSIKAKLVVTVDGTQIGKEVTLTSSATAYTFEADTPLTGDVVLTYTQTSSKALYIKSISINQ